MSRRCTIRFSSAVAGVVALLLSAHGNAIDVPKPLATTPSPPEPSNANITPSDERAFYQKLQHVAHTHNLRGLRASNEVIQALAEGNADTAVALAGSAANTAPDANLALLRIQHWCSRVGSWRAPDRQALLAKLTADLSSQRAARVAGVLAAEAEFMSKAREACGKAAFDYGAIESRLRDAAAAGHPASASELAQFTRDVAKRNALLQAAVDKDHAPAVYALATQRLTAVQRGETTENVASIRALLKQAGRTLPKAKLDLANCMALGCDGHPADTASAQAFGLDAARDGEPMAYLSMVRMPWGGRFSRTQLLAWQYFGERLNESGCMGDAYVMNAVSFAQTIKQLEKNQNEKVLEAARSQADALWSDNGARATKEQGCG